MSLNVQNVNSLNFKGVNFLRQPQYNAERFIQNSYAVKGDLNHPEGRTNYAEDDYRGLNLYCLG